jgi:hypothetical protein
MLALLPVIMLAIAAVGLALAAGAALIILPAARHLIKEFKK